MATTLRQSTCQSLIERIGRLQPDSRPRWGRMTASRMVCHLGDQLRLALGEIEVPATRSPLRFTPIKQLLIYFLPWPKGKIKAPPVALTTDPGPWEKDVATLRALLERFAGFEPAGSWAPHPFFGTMSRGLWAGLTRRHFDYHLRQFGV